MRGAPLLALLLLAVCGCSKTPEEREAAKFPQPKMMSDDQAKQYEQGMNDPRKGGVAPVPGASAGGPGSASGN